MEPFYKVGLYKHPGPFPLPHHLFWRQPAEFCLIEAWALEKCDCCGSGLSFLPTHIFWLLWIASLKPGLLLLVYRYWSYSRRAWLALVNLESRGSSDVTVASTRLVKSNPVAYFQCSGCFGCLLAIGSPWRAMYSWLTPNIHMYLDGWLWLVLRLRVQTPLVPASIICRGTAFLLTSPRSAAVPSSHAVCWRNSNFHLDFCN